MLDTTYDIVFDEEFPGALELRCTGKRGYRLNPTALINISYGHRKFKGHQKFEKTMAVVKPQVNTGYGAIAYKGEGFLLVIRTNA